jgi:hypothetical protein
MKPLVHVPSLGTLRAGPQWAIVFIVVVLSPFALVSLLILAPILPLLSSVHRKRPVWAWRTALFGSLAASLLLVLPVSPLFIGHDRPFREPPLEHQVGFEAFVIPWINVAFIFEIPLLPLLAASAVHSIWTKGPTPGTPAKPLAEAGDAGKPI